MLHVMIVEMDCEMVIFCVGVNLHLVRGKGNIYTTRESNGRKYSMTIANGDIKAA